MFHKNNCFSCPFRWWTLCIIMYMIMLGPFVPQLFVWWLIVLAGLLAIVLPPAHMPNVISSWKLCIIPILQLIIIITVVLKCNICPRWVFFFFNLPGFLFSQAEELLSRYLHVNQLWLFNIVALFKITMHLDYTSE